jgi:hypothetical protein
MRTFAQSGATLKYNYKYIYKKKKEHTALTQTQIPPLFPLHVTGNMCQNKKTARKILLANKYYKKKHTRKQKKIKKIEAHIVASAVPAKTEYISRSCTFWRKKQLLGKETPQPQCERLSSSMRS